MEFAVLDVETTGLHPTGHDRIIEVGIVRLDGRFKEQAAFTTLVNPDRDVGPTWLHGIHARDLRNAPQFGDIAGHISELLEGTILVGHNIRFDLRFLRAEYGLLGFDIGEPELLDTMGLAVQAGAGSRRLAEACDNFGIEQADVHAALADAAATAALVARCVEHMGAERVMAEVRRGSAACRWPRVQPVRSAYSREEASRDRQSDRFLAQLVDDLPASSDTPGNWQEYFAILDRALEDRRLSPSEREALKEAAVDAGLSAADVTEANETYLGSLVCAALADGGVSDRERADIDEVAELLDLGGRVDELIELESARVQAPPAAPGLSADLELQGERVCFTGALNGLIDGERATREVASAIAAASGMVVTKSVTRKLDYLVMADPDSMSGKAKKARSYGVRILAEPVFWAAVGISAE